MYPKKIYSQKTVKILLSIIVISLITACDNSSTYTIEPFNLEQTKKSSTIVEKKSVTRGWFISSLYVAYFNRAPDYEGLRVWMERVKTGRAEGKDTLTILKELSALFAKHPVFTSTYGDMDDKTFVNKIYRNVLGRSGDSQGVDAWTSSLVGGTSRSDMVAEFVEAALTSELTSEEFPTLSSYELARAQKRQDLLLNKAIVSYYFSTKLKEMTNMGQSSSDEVSKLTAVEQDPAYQASKKILRGVTEDRDTVTKKRELIDRLFGFENPMDRLLHDTTPPTITLNAKRAIRIHVGDEYTPPNVVAMDDIDGEVEVTKSGDVVNTDSAGDYRVIYSAVDSQNNKSSVTRRVEVLAVYVPPTPTPVLLSTLKKTGQTTEHQAFDDGYYQTGVTRSYSRSDDMVTDNVTGLIWQDDTEAKTVQKNWADAKTYCTNLTLGGQTDWRLPTVEELVYLTDKGRTNPAIDPAFDNVASGVYWSSTTFEAYPSYAWIVYLDDGYNGWVDKDYEGYVRCARGGQ